MIEAVRYGDQEEVRSRLHQVVSKLDTSELTRLFEDHALAQDSMDSTKVQQIRDEMERAEARKLQPHFISAFFKQAFSHLGGDLKPRETGRHEISHVPAIIRQRDRIIGKRAAVLSKYERICFDKSYYGPGIEFICPGHPLLDAVLDLVLERYRDSLKQGTILIDEQSYETDARVLTYLEHTIQDGRLVNEGGRRVISQQFQFVESYKDGSTINAGIAPYLDYRPVADEELKAVRDLLDEEWLSRDLERVAIEYAIADLVPHHLRDVKTRRESLIDKTLSAVKSRLTAEIIHWDNRAEEIRLAEMAGKTNAKINSQKAFQRAEDLRIRLRKRIEELEQERKFSPLPPVSVGGALIVPMPLVKKIMGLDITADLLFAKHTREIELSAMKAIMETERHLGHDPRDVSSQKVGWDIESRDKHTGRLRLIEVKGRIHTATTVTVTKNEILRALNKGEQFLLAIVLVPDSQSRVPEQNVRYVVQPFRKEPDVGASSVNYEIKELWSKGICPYG
jgi:hypothetical protein